MSTSDHPYLEPGLTVLIPIGLLYVGADVNALIVPDVDTSRGVRAALAPSSETFTSLSAHGQIGLRL